jgi:hypothetical protein
VKQMTPCFAQLFRLKVCIVSGVASLRRHCHVVLHGPFQRDFGGVNVLPGSVFEPF